MDAALWFENPDQHVQARFEVDGRVVVSHQPSPSELLTQKRVPFSVKLHTRSVGRIGNARPFKAKSPQQGACDGSGRVDAAGECLRRVERAGDTVTEWWANVGAGLEQGWTFDVRPTGLGPLAIEVDVEGMDVEIGADNELATFVAGSARLAYGDLAAWDADGNALPAWMERADGGLRVVVDDTAARYPVTVDPMLSTTSVVLSENYAKYGSAVATGDVNGDGYDDLIVGAWKSGAGKAFVYLGSATGVSETASWSMDGEVSGDQFGASVGAADVDGDGMDEVLIGASFHTDTFSREGAVYVVSGQADFTTAAAPPVQKLVGGVVDRYLGTSIGSAGFVNGDAYEDVVVGGTRLDSPVAGEAFVYFGSASGIPSTSDWSASAACCGWFGQSVATAGDVNNDGYDDVIVGATRRTEAYLYYGPDLSKTAGEYTHLTGSSRFGWRVRSAGDVNGDGCVTTCW